MPFKSSNQEWLGSLSKIFFQTLVWLCDQSCLRGAVYCLTTKDCTYTFMFVILEENVQQPHPLLTYIFNRKVHKKGHGQCIFTNNFG